MLKAEGTVVSRQGDSITVHSRTRSGCSQCASQKQCGVGVISQAFPGQTHELSVPITVLDPSTVKAGDTVTVGIDEPRFLQGAMWLYLPPLLGLIAGALIAQSWIGPGDLSAILGAAIGGVTGWVLGRARLRRIPQAEVQLLEHQAVMQPCDDPKPEIR